MAIASLGNMHTAAGRGGLERLYARQASAATYNRAAPAPEAAGQSTATEDVVELSEFAPRPIERSMFRAARQAADKMANGLGLSAEENARLKTDPAFASALAMFSLQNAGGAAEAAGTSGARTSVDFSATLAQRARQVADAWPQDAPTPSTSSLGDYARRLTQRFSGAAEGGDGEALQARRRELSDLARAGAASALATAFAAVA